MEDYLNSRGRRNSNNTSIYDYNCGGYALNTFSWFYPSSESDWEKRDYFFRRELKEFSIEEVYHKYVLRDTYNMIKKFNGKLRRINSIDDIRPGERVIAYRMCYNELDGETDFHFIFRDYGDKKWHHKMGDKEIQRNKFDTNYVLGPVWDSGYYNYDSEIILMALIL